MSETRSARGEQTRELIVTTALRLFREQGYDATTMRAVATAAGVSVGNAYYYFGSKEHLIQAFYDELGEQHRALAGPRVAEHADLAGRLRAALLSQLDVMVPYRGFAGGFFKTAADPQSPLSPFSSESAPARDRGDRVLCRGARRVGREGLGGAATRAAPAVLAVPDGRSCCTGCTTAARVRAAPTSWSSARSRWWSSWSGCPGCR